MANSEHVQRLEPSRLRRIQEWNQWRENNPEVIPDLSEANLSEASLGEVDLSKANLSEANLSEADLGEAVLAYADLSDAILAYANLSEADLTDANLTDANLSAAILTYSNLSGANLGGTNLSDTDLTYVNLSGANLSRANLSGADLSGANLSGANLSGAILTHVNLSGTNLSGTNLSGTNLSGFDLSGFDLSRTNLSRTNLSRTQVLRTSFEEAIFTGACLEDWNINSATKFDDAICKYVYLKAKKKERRPREGTFKPGEFAALFQQAIDTVDLIFKDGIDWQALFQSFQDLREQYDDQDLCIQAIEKKRGGAFVVRVEVPPDSDKSAIESSAKELYESKLMLMEQRYRAELQVKESEIIAYKQQSANLMKITELLATRPPMTEGNRYIFNQSRFAGGFAETVQGDQIGGNITNQPAESITPDDVATDPETPKIPEDL